MNKGGGRGGEEEGRGEETLRENCQGDCEEREGKKAKQEGRDTRRGTSRRRRVRREEQEEGRRQREDEEREENDEDEERGKRAASMKRKTNSDESQADMSTGEEGGQK